MACGKPCRKAVAWCQKKFSKHKLLFDIIVKIISLILYIVNIITDVNAAMQHLLADNFWWGFLTLLFILIPMMCSAFIYTYVIIKISEYSALMKFLLVLPSICCAPIMPIWIFSWEIVVSVRRYKSANHNEDDEVNNQDPVIAELGLVKLVEAMGESYPQAALQMFIVYQNYGNAIGIWQWLTIASSLISLAFGLTTCFLFEKASTISKVSIFFFGLLATSSRLLVCCAYSMIESTWWFLPFGLELGASVIVCGSIIGCRCSICVPLIVTEGHEDIRANIRGYLIPLIIAAYNSFTVSGLTVSTVNLVLAAIVCFMDIPLLIIIITITVSLISCASNAMITYASCFKGVRKDWLNLNENGESWLY